MQAAEAVKLSTAESEKVKAQLAESQVEVHLLKQKVLAMLDDLDSERKSAVAFQVRNSQPLCSSRTLYTQDQLCLHVDTISACITDANCCMCQCCTMPIPYLRTK